MSQGSNPLSRLTADEFEALCNGCGLCCTIGHGYACPALDATTNRCTKYSQPVPRGEVCVKLTPENVPMLELLGSLPESCSYVRTYHGLPLVEPPPRAEWQEYRIAPAQIRRRHEKWRKGWLKGEGK